MSVRELLSQQACIGLPYLMSDVFFFQAEDGIRYLVRSRGLGDVYKRQDQFAPTTQTPVGAHAGDGWSPRGIFQVPARGVVCLSLIHI